MINGGNKNMAKAPKPSKVKCTFLKRWKIENKDRHFLTMTWLKVNENYSSHDKI